MILVRPTVPRYFVAFAPYGVGVLCALFYFETCSDVYGWWIGARDSEYESAYFKLEDYFTTRPTRVYATEGNDLYGGWRFLYSAPQIMLDKPLPVDSDIVHELDRVQNMFVTEWLFFDDSPAALERESYDKMRFPVRYVNIRFAGINRMDRHEPVWLYRSRDLASGVLDSLAQHWPLDYGHLEPETLVAS